MSGQNQDIIVTGWSARYARASAVLLGIEGGHVNDPVDRGGETQFGISLRFLVAEGVVDLDGDGIADFDLDMDGDIDGADIRRLTRGDARYLYHRCFWQRLDADRWYQPIGEMLFDQAVNGGLTAAKKLLQQAINACLAPLAVDMWLKVDGDLGQKTRDAFVTIMAWPGLGLQALVAAFRQAAKDRYRAIVAAAPSQRRFLNGWLARADALGRGL